MTVHELDATRQALNAANEEINRLKEETNKMLDIKYRINEKIKTGKNFICKDKPLTIT